VQHRTAFFIKPLDKENIGEIFTVLLFYSWFSIITKGIK
jgi:hypothetical protein